MSAALNPYGVIALACGMAIMIGLPAAVAQPHSPGYGMQAPGPDGRSPTGIDPGQWLAETLQAIESARAHSRLESASEQPAGPGDAEICPVLGIDLGENEWNTRATGPFVPRRAERLARWRGVAPPSESVSSLFSEYVSSPVVQSKCIYCHVADGISGHTRLVLLPSTEADHVAQNLETFRAFVETVEDGADRILAKIQGVGHGGGVQVPSGSPEFANMERFLRLLGGGGGTSGLSPETLFDAVTMASPEKTLRRATLIFAGRLPTPEELASVADGEISSLRRAIRGVMQGPGFHEFLIRASNDRLLTDAHLYFALGPFNDPGRGFFVDLTNYRWTLAKAASDRGYENIFRDPNYQHWDDTLQYGISRAPLELIAHVVENDRPYTEILTADYIMANPVVAAAYGATTQFDDPEDPEEFRPTRIANYYRTDQSKVSVRDRFGQRIVNPGNLRTDYPHAGILNTTVFLRRYPTTPTNRNRARSRWTYYHFLGLDIEKSASRTTDANALSDTNNPTMNNSACAVCHRVMDPVAGAFQNYGEEGLYRDNRGGLDSLAFLYKFPQDGTESPYQTGDTWYRDMREPGFDGELAPSPDNSLQWLARHMVADPRFAEAAVRFWWPAIMGADVASPPEDERDADYEGQLLASAAQLAEIRQLAEAFRQGFSPDRPYNAKDLLAEIALSPWFRAESITESDPVRDRALRDAGVERLLTPEELERKTEAITGYVWGRILRRWPGGGTSNLNAASARSSAYELAYGGIDSDGIPVRAREMTPLMATVAQSHAVQVSCPIVQREFFIWPESSRRLFRGFDLQSMPDTDHGATAIKNKLVELHTTLLGVTPAINSPDIEDAFRLFVEVRDRNSRTERTSFPGNFTCAWWQDVSYLDGLGDDIFTYDYWGYSRLDHDRARPLMPNRMDDPNHLARAWVVTLAYLLTDYRYLHF